MYASLPEWVAFFNLIFPGFPLFDTMYLFAQAVPLSGAIVFALLASYLH